MPYGTTALYSSAEEWEAFQNIVEMSPLVSYDLAVSDTIISDTEYSCFNAHNIITVAGDGNVVEFESGSIVNLIAEQSVRFLPGFHAYEGSYTHAYITTTGEFCDDITPSSIVYVPEVKSSGVEPLPEPEINFNKTKSVKVYPNPNNGQFTIQLSNFESNVDVCVFNTLGARVYETSNNNFEQIEVNLPEMKQGLYYIRIREGKQQYTEKIVVQ